MKRILLVWLYVGLLSAALGCSSGGVTEEVDTDESKWVRDPVFQKMNTIVRGIDYLPFRYRLDGCYARALYMSMELAVHQLASNVVFAFAQPGWPLHVESTYWGYHVAPLIEVGSSADALTPMVLDPALSPVPVTKQAWMALMGFPDPAASGAPSMLMVPGSDYQPARARAERTWKNKDVPDFAHLPRFRTSDVQAACAVMHLDIGLEHYQDVTGDDGMGTGESAPIATYDGGGPSASQKRAKLLSRTLVLLRMLRARGKLTEDATFSATRCRTGY
ncbi:MAG: hypothetical protein JWM74_1678 [Myxococcaceae bacterium]|nr:hypothetical protein [Myxococcaceae bacterium]